MPELRFCLPGLSFLKERGYKLIIISNQPWIEKKRLTREQVELVFKSITDQLHEFGIEIIDYYFCPHSAITNCDCRKPRQKLIQEAIAKHQIDITQSYFVGDMETDIQAGKTAGLKTILVKTGCGKNYSGTISPDYTIDDLNKIREVIKHE